jgi:hypothetical protein
MKYLKILLLFSFVLYLLSCEKEKFITDKSARLAFSMDTVYFDTVFTTLGTATRRFTVRNKYNDFVRISSVKLAKGSKSVFRVNLDGVPGTEFSDVEIAPRDSLFVFVNATLDPNNSNGILLQQDSIVFTLNGITQDVDLVAWGQDVHILRDSLLGTQTWTNEKPYLILDAAGIDSLNVLTIEEGTKIYFHRNAAFYVFGTLIVQGTKDKPVIFHGDRLEKLYEDIPGQWQFIVFTPGSKNNSINYAEITGGMAGLVLQTIPGHSDPIDLIISNSKIMHMSAFGIRAADAGITGFNNVFSTCGISALAFEVGGNYEFYHCTIANRFLYGNSRNTPSVYLNNFYIYKDADNQDKVIVNDMQKASFRNCIIYGGLQNELGAVRYKDQGVLNFIFDHCLTRFDPVIFNLNDKLHFTDIWNQHEPGFVSWDKYDFHPDSASFIIDKGDLSTGTIYPLDLDAISRTTDGKPDLGAFEYIHR